jgi:multisubunit Na+/H+ antiporter MnhF subunit
MIITGKKEYMDIVIILSLVVFIATVAISKYLTKGGQND